MPDLRISDLFQIRNRFLRSAHLKRDFIDTSALKGYVVTPHVKASLDRLVSGLAANSGHRAWRIHGRLRNGEVIICPRTGAHTVRASGQSPRATS